jgi:4-carboxymuconolactone decarboxylase
MGDIRRPIAVLWVLAASLLIPQDSIPVAAQEPSTSRGKAAAAYAATLPKDVYADSGNRFPLIKREEMSELGKKLYDLSVTGTRPVPGLQGPLGILLYSPRLDEHVRNQTQYLRRDSDLGPRLFELAVLVTSREVNQQFAWTVHEPAALDAGLEPAIIDLVRYRKPITGLGDKEAAIIQLSRESVNGTVRPETFARCLKLFGKRGVVDLASVIGYYASIAVLLNTFDQQLPLGQKPLLPTLADNKARPVAAQKVPAASGSSESEYAASIPKDVYPDSGSRLPLIKREDMDEAGKALYDTVVAETNPVPGLHAPPGIWLYSPRLNEHIRKETQYLRRDAALGSRLFELTVLVTAREVDQQFAWTAHEIAGRRAGLEQSIIDIVKDHKPVTGLGDKEAVIIELGREAIGKRKVSADTFARALKLFGKEELVDTVWLMGRYASIAVLLNTFDQQLYPGWKPLLPM